MNFFVQILTANLVLSLCVLSWMIAQILKVIIQFLRFRQLELRYLLSSGGMPSSHSSVVCTCAVSVGLLTGWDSVTFALAAILAFVVMYDAANVRREAGKQAKIINYIMENKQEMRPDFYGKALKELLGHTPLQVMAGGILGIAVAVAGVDLLAGMS
ncbi:MAG: divergent PAP2 family protein [Oscillospiraceae bacterium]|nr:divergent PAP2 family protein [Oscillospiraceae bacterium]